MSKAIAQLKPVRVELALHLIGQIGAVLLLVFVWRSKPLEIFIASQAWAVLLLVISGFRTNFEAYYYLERNRAHQNELWTHRKPGVGREYHPFAVAVNSQKLRVGADPFLSKILDGVVAWALFAAYCGVTALVLAWGLIISAVVTVLTT